MSDTFGFKMRSVREEQGLSLEDVVRATRIPAHHLRALEEDDFAGLPDEARVEEYLRSYAGFLDVDPDLVIEDYVRERDSRKTERSVVEAPVSPARPGRPGRSLLMLVSVGIVIVVAMIVMLREPPRDTTETVTFEPRAVAVTTRPQAPPPGSATPAVRTTPLPEPVEEEIDVEAFDSTGPSIPDHGVGTGVRDDRARLDARWCRDDSRDAEAGRIVLAHAQRQDNVAGLRRGLGRRGA
jgi:transcriptional regulator with XRE-family HTH domain